MRVRSNRTTFPTTKTTCTRWDRMRCGAAGRTTQTTNTITIITIRTIIIIIITNQSVLHIIIFACRGRASTPRTFTFPIGDWLRGKHTHGVIAACRHHRHRPPHRGQTAHIRSSPHGRRDAKNVLTALRVRVRVCEEAGAVLCVTCAFFSRTFSHIRSVCVRVSSSHWCNIVRACVHL